MAPAHAVAVAVPGLYRLVFLWLEPVSILAGAVCAYARPDLYLRLTHSATAPPTITIATSIVMTQLANLYLGLALLEATVLRATADLHVWRIFLFGLLVADVGHLYSVRAVGHDVYWAWWRWNAIDWGNVPFVYFLAVTRLCFLLGVGRRSERPKSKAK